jgi:peptidoglycan/LPS O-acetylase OafA/YrhL
MPETTTFISINCTTGKMSKTPGYLETKPHYEILDGLRGVAAIFVVTFHMFESFTFEKYLGGPSYPQYLGHGYLAVDFFFLLSGFVIGYAYDDRWGRMTTWDFFKRRLVRLQPMIIVGSIVGAVLFYFQAGAVFPNVAHTSLIKMLLVMVIGFTLFPVWRPLDIRGWTEMHPLNGPAWSLFFEYVGNFLYAVLVRRFSKLLLTILVIISALFLLQWLLFGPSGNVIGGWAIDDPVQMHIGFARLLFPFFGGLLLFRIGKRISINNAFGWCSVILVAFLAAPVLGGTKHLWENGLFEGISIIIVFPIIVAIGAGGHIVGKRSAKVCKFLGDISYPIYITHYPLIYVFTAWVTNKKIMLSQGLPVGVGLIIVAILLAWAYLKLYDEPVRAWLKRRFLMKTA